MLRPKNSSHRGTRNSHSRLSREPIVPELSRYGSPEMLEAIQNAAREVSSPKKISERSMSQALAGVPSRFYPAGVVEAAGTKHAVASHQALPGSVIICCSFPLKLSNALRQFGIGHLSHEATRHVRIERLWCPAITPIENAIRC